MRVFKKNICKRICVIMLSATLALSGGLSGIKADAAKKAIKSVSVTNVDGKKLVLKKGKKFKLKTKVVKNDKNAKTTLKITSSNKKVVKVTKKGELKAVKNGKATITVKSTATPSKYVKIKLTVGTPVKSVNVSKTSINGTVGEVVSLGASVTPKNASVKTLKYTTANKKVATVDSKGKVKLVGVGTTTVTAISTDGHAKKKIVKVTVKKAEETVEPTTPTPSVEPTTPTSSTDPTTVTPSVEPAKPTPSVDPAPTPNPNPTPNPSEDPVGPAPDPEPVMSEASTLSREGYTEVWKEEFDGTELNRDDWNVELHDPRWVNQELQAYVDSSDNIKVKDGKLYLIPIETEKNGEKSYTSGRINTQDKHKYKYGLFEATVKVPVGKGYLPAFWMMPETESLYGQWPKCGEIDCMEVMGQETDKLYGTIHYGAPHKETQGTATIKNNKYIETTSKSDPSIDGNYLIENGKSFSEEFHTFSVEWEPDRITWYVDGIKYHEAKDWFSAVEGGGEQTYPAPFDQDFYLILNLAVGGSWVTYPDETTTYGEQSAFVVDSVKVSQKSQAYYAEKEANATKPVTEVKVKEADANGNFITNGNFATDINKATDWELHLESDATASTYSVANNSITINPSIVGTEAHTVQLKQEGLPLERGVKYEVSFKARASEARKLLSDIKAPDRGYKVYKQKTVNLTTSDQPFSYEFTMDEKSDYNSTLEFNLGKLDSTASVTISDVVLKVKDASGKVDENSLHEVRPDGNYVYNGTFSEGTGRLGFWTIAEKDKDYISVTNEKASERWLKVEAPSGTSVINPVIISQDKLTFTPDDYVLSYRAYKENCGGNDQSLTIKVAGNEYTKELKAKATSYDNNKFAFENETENPNKIEIIITAPGTYYIDDIFVCEDAMLKNGSFDAGLACFEVYKADGTDATAVIDKENNNAFDITIDDTGANEWDIQLKQTKISLEKGKWYRLALKAKSSPNRNIKFALQRDGAAHKTSAGKEDWTSYSSKIVSLTDTYDTYESIFQMTEPDDPGTIFSISLGADGVIDRTLQNNVCIDDIVLEEIEDPNNILKNQFFELDNEGIIKNWGAYAENGAGEAEISFKDKKATFYITNVGTQNWHVGLNQTGFKFKKGYDYTLTFKASSDKARNIQASFQNGDSVLKSEPVSLTNDMLSFEVKYSHNSADVDGKLQFNLGKVDDTAVASKVTIQDVILVEKKADETQYTENMIKNPTFESADGEKAANWNGYFTAAEGAAGTLSYSEGKATYALTSVGENAWSVALQQGGLKIEKGEKYILKFKASSSVARGISVGVQSVRTVEGNDVTDWHGGSDIDLTSTLTEKTIEFTPANIPDGQDYVTATLNFSLGVFTTYGESGPVKNPTDPSTITISDVSLVKVDNNLVKNASFKKVEGVVTGWEADGAEYTLENGVATFPITNVGADDGAVYLQQDGFTLKEGVTYKLSFTASSTAERKINVLMQKPSGNYDWYGGDGDVVLTDTPRKVEITIGPKSETLTGVRLKFALGKLTKWDVDGKHVFDTPASTITISDIKLEEVPAVS